MIHRFLKLAFGCAGSLLQEHFSCSGEHGLLFSVRARGSPSGGVSSCGAQTPGTQASGAAAAGSRTQDRHGARGIFPVQELNLCSLHLQLNS